MNYKLDWQSNESHVFINPRTPVYEKSKLNSMIKKFNLQGHIFLTTSGSTAIHSTDIKWVALKKTAFLTSALSVNKHLHCSKNDIFLNTLPHFHVGGLALFARAELCGGSITDIYNETYKWNPHYFVSQLIEKKITITSLVPTQLYDLVENELKPSASLRAVVVGGGFLNKELYMKAKLLNWPILPSYGMTECSSQIATAEANVQWNSDYPQLTVLPHLNVKISSEGKIIVSGESLLTGYIFQGQSKIEFIDPKINGEIETSDIGEFIENKLFVYGRADENIKINGENVSLIRLQTLLQQAKEKANLNKECAVIALEDHRQGHKIAVVFNFLSKDEKQKIDKTISFFNNSVFPFERIASVHFIDSIPLTELGKVKRNLIQNIIQKQVQYGY